MSDAAYVDADGTLQIGLPPAEVSAAVQDSSLQWQPGQNGTMNLSVPLGAMGDALHQGALLLRLSTVTNADLSIEHASALISGLPQENLTVAFDMQPDQVCLPVCCVLTGQSLPLA